MFTGIIESTGKVLSIHEEGSNKTFQLSCSFLSELKIDQSLAHNGVCLTVTDIRNDSYSVTAIAETLRRTNLGALKSSDVVNLERCMKADGRLDGHIVQGHVDLTGNCASIQEENGSWIFEFTYNASSSHYTVEKGSICVNGVSLTVVDSSPGKFSVAIIPYTYEHTGFHALLKGDTVNLEFDVIGKYVTAYMNRIHSPK
ncbi:riboflavin synthase [soil metagenome]